MTKKEKEIKIPEGALEAIRDHEARCEALTYSDLLTELLDKAKKVVCEKEQITIERFLYVVIDKLLSVPKEEDSEELKRCRRHIKHAFLYPEETRENLIKCIECENFLNEWNFECVLNDAICAEVDDYSSELNASGLLFAILNNNNYKSHVFGWLINQESMLALRKRYGDQD